MRGLGKFAPGTVGVLLCLIASRAAAQATSIRPLVPNPRREQPLASSSDRNADPVARRTRPRRARGVPRWRHGGESARQARRRRDRRRREGRRAPLRQGLRLLRRRAPRARGRRAYALSHRLDEQAVHVDRGHAAGRAGEARSRYGRQSLPRLQDSGDLSAADHAPAHHDALAGLRGGRTRSDHRRLDAHDSARSLARDAHSRARPAARAHFRRTRTTRPRSRATSSSARPACRSTTTSSSTSSRRSA